MAHPQKAVNKAQADSVNMSQAQTMLIFSNFIHLHNNLLVFMLTEKKKTGEMKLKENMSM